MPCGRGVFFIDDVPFVQEVFPVTNPDNPMIVDGFVFLEFSYDVDGYEEWNMTYCHTASMKGMVKQNNYDAPKLRCGAPANDSPTRIRPTETINAFQNAVMAPKNVLGHPLIINYLDYLSLPKERIETHLDQFATGILNKLNDYRKTHTLSEKGEESLDILIEKTQDMELNEFTFSIYVPRGLLAGIPYSYCVMPRRTESNPFNNFSYDQYSPEVPEKIRATFVDAIKKARDDFDLTLSIDHERVEKGIEHLRKKYTKDGTHIRSNHLRHKRRRLN